MPFQPIPDPLRQILARILHANLFAGWRDELTRWEIATPEEARTLRYQMAVAALTDTIDPEEFKRLTGHWVTDPVSTRAWFAEIYEQYYGRLPEPRDAGIGI